MYYQHHIYFYFKHKWIIIFPLTCKYYNARARNFLKKLLRNYVVIDLFVYLHI